MKNYFLSLILICSLAVPSKSQVLGVRLVVQEQSEWCWAGCTKCILNYYRDSISQCTIADYVRTVATWHSFGTTNCCTNASLGCNYWNYNWGTNGSIQDILVHFANIANHGVPTLTTAEITSEIAANHLFVVRWAWTTGGGHFVVGHGISGSGSAASIYYMNPWPGEGMSIGTYSWMLSGVNGMGNHTWSGTNVITSLPASLAVNQPEQVKENGFVYPNPTNGFVSIKCSINDVVEIFDVTGKLIYGTTAVSEQAGVDMSLNPKGLYVVKLRSLAGVEVARLVLE